MFRTAEGFDRLIQNFSLDGGGRFVKCSVMSCETISKCMETEVLTILISVIPFCFRCMEKSQTDGIVIRFIPAIFTVIQDRYAVAVVLIGQVCPLLRIYFVSGLYIIASFHAADSQIVSSLFIFYIQRKLCFQQRVC